MTEQTGELSTAETELVRRKTEIGQEVFALLAYLSEGNAPYATTRINVGCADFDITVSLLGDPGDGALLIPPELAELIIGTEEA